MRSQKTTPNSLPKRQRLVLVYNPRSSGYKKVEDAVISPLRAEKNLTLLKFAVQPTNVDDNAFALSKLLQDDDLVLSAGGDGTATIALNGVMLAQKDTRFAVLGFGNFNDFARMLGFYDFDYVRANFFDKQNYAKIYPLEIKIDGEHWRYASSYLTAGLFAESTKVFDEPEVRQFLQKHGKNLFFSVLMLAKWYFRNKKRQFLPEFSVNGEKVKTKTTDLMAVNSKTMAKMMRGGRFFAEKDEFLLATARLGSFWRLVWFMMRSVLHRVPGKATDKVKIEFSTPAEIELQAEGEYQRFSGVEKIEIKKARGINCLVK